MFKVNLIEKINITLNFGGDRKIEVGAGRGSKAVLVLTSPLANKSIDLSENKSQVSSPKIKKIKRSN